MIAACSECNVCVPPKMYMLESLPHSDGSRRWASRGDEVRRVEPHEWGWGPYTGAPGSSLPGEEKDGVTRTQ